MILILVGIVLLYIGAEALVRGAYNLAIRLGMTTLVAGLTIVSFSTSMPEGVTSFVAQVVGDYGDIAIGNIIGSNIANVGLILGLTALIRPLKVQPIVRKREMPIMLAALIVLIITMFFPPIGRIAGGVLVALLVIYIALQIHWGSQAETPPKSGNLPWNLFFVFGGIIGLIAGGYSLVEGAVAVATQFGIPNRVIAVSVVAIGTSLPELAATLVAAFRGHDDIAIGNVIGSNVFNALFITGVVALAAPIAFSSKLLTIDAPIMLGFSLILWALTIPKILGRISGGALLILYAAYITWVTLS